MSRTFIAWVKTVGLPVGDGFEVVGRHTDGPGGGWKVIVKRDEVIVGRALDLMVWTYLTKRGISKLLCSQKYLVVEENRHQLSKSDSHWLVLMFRQSKNHIEKRQKRREKTCN